MTWFFAFYAAQTRVRVPRQRVCVLVCVRVCVCVRVTYARSAKLSCRRGKSARATRRRAHLAKQLFAFAINAWSPTLPARCTCSFTQICTVNVAAVCIRDTAISATFRETIFQLFLHGNRTATFASHIARVTNLNCITFTARQRQ